MPQRPQGVGKRKPTGMGRRWRRGQPPQAKPFTADALMLMPVIELADGTKLPYVIKQLFPAEGWQARYREEDGTTFTNPFAFLAWVEITQDGETKAGFLGIDCDEAGWCLVSEYDNWLGLVPPWDAETDAEGA